MPNTMKWTVALATVLLSPITSFSARADSPLLWPPGTPLFGKSFADWNFQQVERAIGVGLGGGSSIPARIGDVRFQPDFITAGSGADYYVSLLPTEYFVGGPFFVFGESYDNPNVPDDTPQLIEELDIFGTVQVSMLLNGATLMAGTGEELAAYMYGPTYFSTPIVYSTPQYRFDLDDGTPVYATSALFAQGIGAILRPLPAGEYLLSVATSSPILGDFEYRYHITVVPEPQSLLLLGLGTIGVTSRILRRRHTRRA